MDARKSSLGFDADVGALLEEGRIARPLRFRVLLGIIALLVGFTWAGSAFAQQAPPLWQKELQFAGYPGTDYTIYRFQNHASINPQPAPPLMGAKMPSVPQAKVRTHCGEIHFFMRDDLGSVDLGSTNPKEPFLHGIQFGQGANAIWQYGAPVLITFKPDLRADPSQCLCFRWRFVQIASSTITVNPPGGPQRIETTPPFIDAPTSDTDPHYRGQFEPAPVDRRGVPEEAASDFPGMRSPWTIRNADGSRKYPKDTRIDIDFHFTTWTVCPGSRTAVSRSRIQGAVRWGFKLALVVGDGPDDTIQGVKGGKPLARGFTALDPDLGPDLTVYRLLLESYPEYQ